MTAQPCHCAELEAVVERMTEALKGMIVQFAFHGNEADGENSFSTGGLSALEEAFDVLGFKDVVTESDFSSPALSSLLARREAERKEQQDEK